MTELIGHGIYSVPEAARLSGIPAMKIRRWVFGHHVKARGSDTVEYRPGIWEPEYSDEEEPALSFHDLLEVRFVHAFRTHGVSLQAIRVAAAHARELLDTHYPFTCRQFQTDGRSVFGEIVDEVSDADDRKKLLDLVKRQYVFRDVVAPSLYRGIEYDQDGDALRWFPKPRDRHIVLDPERVFGKPILTDYAVPTETIAAAVTAEGDPKIVARLYELPLNDVERAVRFEQGLAQLCGCSLITTYR